MPAIERECSSEQEQSMLENSPMMVTLEQFSVTAEYVCDHAEGNIKGSSLHTNALEVLVCRCECCGLMKG